MLLKKTKIIWTGLQYIYKLRSKSIRYKLLHKIFFTLYLSNIITGSNTYTYQNKLYYYYNLSLYKYIIRYLNIFNISRVFNFFFHKEVTIVVSKHKCLVSLL